MTKVLAHINTTDIPSEYESLLSVVMGLFRVANLDSYKCGEWLQPFCATDHVKSSQEQCRGNFIRSLQFCLITLLEKVQFFLNCTHTKPG